MADAEDGDTDTVLAFNMTHVLTALVLFGAWLGMSLAKPIPLFPGWLGAVLGGGIVGYGGTLRNGRGDLAR